MKKKAMLLFAVSALLLTGCTEHVSSVSYSDASKGDFSQYDSIDTYLEPYYGQPAGSAHTEEETQSGKEASYSLKNEDYFAAREDARERESVETAASEEESVSEEEEYILPDSDSRYLEMRELAGFTDVQCRLARNELFARHGRRFSDEALQAYFDSCSWYEGIVEPDDFDEAVFNAYEIANRDLIIRYEKEQGYR